LLRKTVVVGPPGEERLITCRMFGRLLLHGDAGLEDLRGELGVGAADPVLDVHRGDVDVGAHAKVTFST